MISCFRITIIIVGSLALVTEEDNVIYVTQSLVMMGKFFTIGGGAPYLFCGSDGAHSIVLQSAL